MNAVLWQGGNAILLMALQDAPPCKRGNSLPVEVYLLFVLSVINSSGRKEGQTLMDFSAKITSGVLYTYLSSI